MQVTPELLEATYELLRMMRPFRAWNLPHADNVVFRVIKGTRLYGQHCGEDNKHEITISATRHTSLGILLATMAHEMVHAHQHIRKDRDAHGKTFQHYADQVCKQMGFDRGSF